MKMQMGMKYRIYPNKQEQQSLAVSLGMPDLCIIQHWLPEKSTIKRPAKACLRITL